MKEPCTGKTSVQNEIVDAENNAGRDGCPDKHTSTVYEHFRTRKSTNREPKPIAKTWYLQVPHPVH